MTEETANAVTPVKSKNTQTETLKTMLKSGLHFGHRTSKWNPKMKPFIFGERGGIHIIDLVQSLEYLEKAKAILKEYSEKGKTILFLCTKKQGQQKLMEVATRAHMPFVSQRWIGGLFTNFSEIKNRINYLNELYEKEANGEFESMIKKEKVRLKKKMGKLEDIFGGLRLMKKVPDMLFIIDPKREQIAIKEAKALGIPVMATLDTNSDPDDVDFPIPANDDAIRSIEFLLNTVGDVVETGRKKFELEGSKVKPIKTEGFKNTPHTPLQKKEVKKEVPIKVAPLSEILSSLSKKHLETVLAAYKDLSAIKKATKEDLEALDGIGAVSVSKILELIK